MTSAEHIMHALGVASLCVFAGAGGLAAYAIASTISPNWRRMVEAYHGHPVPPAAPAIPPVASTPSRRGVGAAAAPAIRTIGRTHD